MGIKSPMAPPLRGDIKTDVLVVGGGAAGLAAAFRLAKAGVKTVLLERNICGGSSMGKSAGFLTPDSELELAQLMRRFGPKGARHLWEAATAGVETIREAISEFDITCDWLEQDCLYVSKDRGTWRDVQDEFKIRQGMNYPATLYDAKQLAQTLGAIGYTGGVRYPGTYAFNPLLYAQGLKMGLLQRGVQIYEATAVNSLQGHTVHSDMGSVTADKIIFCVDKPRPELTKYFWNVYTAQTFLSISEPLSEKNILRMFPHGRLQCWDSDLIYTYYRLTGDGRILLGGRQSDVNLFQKRCDHAKGH